MADIIPVKAIRTGSDVTALGEMTASDTIPGSRLNLAAPGSIGGTTPAAGSFTLLSANGLKFPATQSASADANTLDDYEEGTWTPTLEGVSGASGQTYSETNGIYTKIGNIVTIAFQIYLPTLGTLSGEYVVIKGLPFSTATSGARGGVAIAYFNTANGASVSVIGNATGNVIYLNYKTAAASDYTIMPPSAFANGAQVNGSVTYRVA